MALTQDEQKVTAAIAGALLVGVAAGWLLNGNRDKISSAFSKLKSKVTKSS